MDAIRHLFRVHANVKIKTSMPALVASPDGSSLAWPLGALGAPLGCPKAWVFRPRADFQVKRRLLLTSEHPAKVAAWWCLGAPQGAQLSFSESFLALRGGAFRTFSGFPNAS